MNKLQGNEINLGSDEKLKSFFKKKINNDNMFKDWTVAAFYILKTGEI